MAGNGDGRIEGGETAGAKAVGRTKVTRDLLIPICARRRRRNGFVTQLANTFAVEQLNTPVMAYIIGDLSSKQDGLGVVHLKAVTTDEFQDKRLERPTPGERP